MDRPAYGTADGGGPTSPSQQLRPVQRKGRHQQRRVLDVGDRVRAAVSVGQHRTRLLGRKARRGSASISCQLRFFPHVAVITALQPSTRPSFRPASRPPHCPDGPRAGRLPRKSVGRPAQPAKVICQQHPASSAAALDPHPIPSGISFCSFKRSGTTSLPAPASTDS